MATVPLSGTDIRLLSGIPFANDYKHTRWFNSVSEQSTWFTSRNVVHSISQANFQRIEGKHFIAVNKSIDELWGTNYLMFRNADYNNKWFYAFVTKLEYKQRNNTHVHFQIDVLQTWRFEMNFRRSYVIREHRPLWNSDGTPVINTIDEGLHYGTEYDNVYTTNIRPMGRYKWLVIIAKELLHKHEEDNNNHEKGSVKANLIGTPQPLSYYLVPFDHVTGDAPNVLIKGSDGDVDPITRPQRILSEIYKNEDAVNNIVSMYVTDYIGIQAVIHESGSPSVPDTLEFHPNADIYGIPISDGLYVLYCNHLPEFMATEVYTGNVFDHFTKPTESKLLMYPYTVIILDDFKGNRVEFRPEYIKDGKLRVQVKGSLGVSNFVTYAIMDYNNSGIGRSTYEILDNETALVNSNAEDVTVLNDMLAAFLQGNRNSLETKKSSIVWNGAMSAVGNTIGGVASAMTANPVGVASSVTGIAQGLGNSVLDLQAIQSKQKDIDNIPPQIAKMGSNTAYNSGNRYNGVWLIKKQIKPEYRKILEDFFGMFGYKTNQVKIPNFRTRQNWNYVQTKECNITGNFNNEDLQELKNIFDNGITLWHTDDVGNYDLSNGVR